MQKKLTNDSCTRRENESMDNNSKHGKCFLFLKRHLLILLVLTGVAVGFAAGFGGRKVHPSEESIIWIGLPGELFMRMLKMTILPLVVSTVITGTASLNPKDNGRVGVFSLAVVMLTNAFGALLAVALFFTFKPGHEIQTSNQSDTTVKSTHLQTNDMFVDMIRNMFPDNMVTACFQKTQTLYEEEIISAKINNTELTTSEHRRSIGKTNGINILGVIIICTVLGIATAKIGESGRPFINFFTALAEVIMTVLNWFIWFTPIGVASLIAEAIIRVPDIGGAFESLGMYVACFTTGTVIHQLVLVPLLYVCVVRRNPLQFMLSAVRPMMAAFGPPSAAVAMPDMLKTLENANGVDPRISRFVIPVETALAKFGSSAFICLSALFLIKVEESSIAVTDVILVFILSTVGSFAIPAVPSSSIITVMIILSSLNVPAQNIGLLLALEWFTDRFRTSGNVLSMVLGGIIIDHFCRKYLENGNEKEIYMNIDVDEKDDIHVLESNQCAV